MLDTKEAEYAQATRDLQDLAEYRHIRLEQVIIMQTNWVHVMTQSVDNNTGKLSR